MNAQEKEFWALIEALANKSADADRLSDDRYDNALVDFRNAIKESPHADKHLWALERCGLRVCILQADKAARDEIKEKAADERERARETPEEQRQRSKEHKEKMKEAFDKAAEEIEKTSPLVQACAAFLDMRLYGMRLRDATRANILNWIAAEEGAIKGKQEHLVWLRNLLSVSPAFGTMEKADMVALADTFHLVKKVA